MIINKIRLLDYLTSHKKNLIILLLLVFIIDYCSEPAFMVDNLLIDSITLILAIIGTILIFGYGLQVTRDVTYNGSYLPDIKIKEAISLGIKFLIIDAIFIVVQAFLLSVVSYFIHFPDLELEELILNLGETIEMIFSYNPINAIIFIILCIIITYITVFFFEIALAKLADNGSLIEALNVKKIKLTIDKIGWKYYAIDYTKIIVAILIISYFEMLVHHYFPRDYVLGVFLPFLIFIIEFIGIGYVYRESKEEE